MKIILSNPGHPTQSIDEILWLNPQFHRVLQQNTTTSSMAFFLQPTWA